MECSVLIISSNELYYYYYYYYYIFVAFKEQFFLNFLHQQINQM